MTQGKWYKIGRKTGTILKQIYLLTNKIFLNIIKNLNSAQTVQIGLTESNQEISVMF